MDHEEVGRYWDEKVGGDRGLAEASAFERG